MGWFGVNGGGGCHSAIHSVGHKSLSGRRGNMSGVLYVAVVSRVLDICDAARQWLPSYLRGQSSRRSIYTPKEDSSVGYAGGSTSRATATPLFRHKTTETPRVAKRSVKSSSHVSL